MIFELCWQSYHDSSYLNKEGDFTIELLIFVEDKRCVCKSLYASELIIIINKKLFQKTPSQNLDNEPTL